MWRCSDAELNCVSTYTRRRPELMQLEMGMSTRRYLPASGTAGLARSLVSGNNRVPWPPPMMTESTLLVLTDCRPVCDIKYFFSRLRMSYTPAIQNQQAQGDKRRFS